jgi:hypothetical protein
MTEDAEEKRTSMAAHALKLKAGAALKRDTATYLARRGDPTGARFERREAAAMDKKADAFLTLPEKPAIGTGGELMLARKDAGRLPGIACTVEDPDRTTVEASLERLEMAGDAGCLALAADAAETIQARNSLEKMLAPARAPRWDEGEARGSRNPGHPEQDRERKPASGKSPEA